MSEIPYSEDVREAIHRELDSICRDANFRSSRRNCEFLRYVVTQALEGRAADIKERTVGVVLFGRPASYDTGADAVVRVRANDVRKRLVHYYEEHSPQFGWRIDLPLGTYVPRFEQESGTEQEHPRTSKVGDSRPILSLGQLAAPTLVALFLCAAMFRWQIFSASPYFEFWRTLVGGRSAVILVLDADEADPGAVTVDDLREITPLVAVAESFHAATRVQTSANSGDSDPNTIRIHISHHDEIPGMPVTVAGALVPQGKDPTAYVTVIPAAVPTLWINSGNRDALDLAIRTMCTEGSFPRTIDNALQQSTISRIRIEENRPISAESTIIRSPFQYR